MIGFFITIFVLAWKLTLILLGLFITVIILFWLAYGVLWTLGAILEPFAKSFNATFKYFGVKTWEGRKREYKQGKEPGWFDKINLWWEGNNENNR